MADSATFIDAAAEADAGALSCSLRRSSRACLNDSGVSSEHGELGSGPDSIHCDGRSHSGVGIASRKPGIWGLFASDVPGTADAP